MRLSKGIKRSPTHLISWSSAAVWTPKQPSLDAPRGIYLNRTGTADSYLAMGQLMTSWGLIHQALRSMFPKDRYYEELRWRILNRPITESQPVLRDWGKFGLIC